MLAVQRTAAGQLATRHQMLLLLLQLLPVLLGDLQATLPLGQAALLDLAQLFGLLLLLLQDLLHHILVARLLRLHFVVLHLQPLLQLLHLLLPTVLLSGFSLAHLRPELVLLRALDLFLVHLVELGPLLKLLRLGNLPRLQVLQDTLLVGLSHVVHRLRLRTGELAVDHRSSVGLAHLQLADRARPQPTGQGFLGGARLRRRRRGRHACWRLRLHPATRRVVLPAARGFHQNLVRQAGLVGLRAKRPLGLVARATTRRALLLRRRPDRWQGHLLALGLGGRGFLLGHRRRLRKRMLGAALRLQRRLRPRACQRRLL
mmetsp:Transcript_58011/g.149321  ORF Transcript_58011/g.149321 Transcript_58011/m.149321 type:complete len:316 (+) Transcript_58011:742-1689(+)